MGAKKSRERFSIKFNESDPSHNAVIEILEQQGPRRKAQFIVNAVLHYIHCSETPDIAAAQPVDRDYIEHIIKEILSRQGDKRQASEPVISQPEKQEIPLAEHEKPEKKGLACDTTITDEATLALISATLSAFRNT